ncbi:endonuclease III [Clostridium sp. CAG:710]|mgnify:FL=1|nr:endonuclease III [Clostridium sp. CAG:710]
MQEIFDYLDALIPNPKCELNFNCDYELLIAVVLSAQTTDKRVNEVTKVLFTKYPTLEDINKADISSIKEIIKSIGTFNKKAVFVKEIAKTLLEKYDGVVPRTHEELEAIPGVGHKSANVVLGVLYNIPTFAVDTHVERVSKRLGLASAKDDVTKVEKKLMKKVPKDRWIRTHHQFILFGRYYCKAVKPSCDNCKLKDICHKDALKRR